jgi:hypothetical protein
MVEVELTHQGYLHIEASVAQCYFPGDALVALVQGNELLLLPTRGAGGGGLLLKQRNARGDRSVLIWEALPANTAAGRRVARWDAEQSALRIPLEATIAQ